MKKEAMDQFQSLLTQTLGETFELKWDIDRKGVVCGWCKLAAPDDIVIVAEVVAELKGRVMTISPLNTPSPLVEQVPVDSENMEQGKSIQVVINYHFYFNEINLTAAITLPDDQRTVNSITPILRSADWHEREMQELFNIKLQGHPNPKRLFLDKDIYMQDHTMIPLSEALNGASTNTLWERIMEANQKGANSDEHL
ncbi:Respiratory-chain NADH dehydrogenase, subunit [Propionispira arboris]|uniref:Respiratory-chain NADH dehydrogenase, subunit n=1 Tax=Propionispira arboris TaxID=84035 RepID=A0A1H6XGQ3_9FIRM|nr:NADH-quinone oxidoreductase subunit C [Propionispira arboris]SEJ28273.1 Respiratory-chain NADH dehydrogenase, subunit [Propionispira arboris]